MSFLKKNAEQPAGSLPPGLLNKVMVILATVLVLALILSTGFCGGGEEETATEEQQAPGATGSVDRPVDAALDRAIVDQQRRAEAARRAAEREEQLRQPERAGDVPGLRENLAILTGLMEPDSVGNIPDPDAVELRRQIELEELEREIRSVRAAPVVQSFRDAGRGGSATGEERGGPTELPPLPDPADALLRTLPTASPANTLAPPAGELDIPLPNSANLPEYENPPRLIDPDDPAGWERVYEGSFLEAVLVNQLSGEFPGPALAVVNVPFHSADRQRVLIPRGSRLIGTAQAVRRRDQGALAVGFHRLVLPDGRHVPLRFLGLNQAGQSGLSGEVDRHYLSTFLAAGAVGLLSGLAIYQGNPYGGGSGGLFTNAGTGLAGTGDQILERFLNRLPTITVRAGHRLRVWFTSDLLIPRPQPQP